MSCAGALDVSAAIGGVGPSSLALIDSEEGLAPDGRVKKTLKSWAKGQLDEVVAQAVDKHDLTPEEELRLRAALTGVKDAKLREYWQKRGPVETVGLVGRSASVTGVMLAIGLSSPLALIPAAIGLAVGLAGRGTVLYKKLEHALEGRAKLELREIEKARGLVPQEDGALDRIGKGIATKVIDKATAKYALDEATKAQVEAAVDDARVTKVEELLRSRLPIEVGTIVATAAVTAAVGVGLAVMTPVAAVVVGATGLLAAGISAAFSLFKVKSSLEGTAYSKLEELAPSAPEGTPLSELAKIDGVREKHALDAAVAVREKFTERFKLSPAESAELDKRLTKVAHQKHVELWGHRLGPTMASQLGRGGAVAGIASSLSADPTLIAGALITSVAEAAVSATLLYKQLDAALEGAAYAYIKLLQRKEPTA